MKNITQKILLASLALCIFTAVPVSAQSLSDEITGQYDKSAAKAEIGKKDLRLAATEMIKYSLTFLGGIFMLLVVYAGYNLITAGGEEEKVEKAQKILKGAIIGLIVILASYTITELVAKSAKQVISGKIEGQEPIDYSK